MRRAPAMVGAAALLLGVFLTPQLASAQEPPNLIVAPADGLVDGATLNLHGTGFEPDSHVRIGQCGAPSQADDAVCAYEPVWPPTDGAGTFDVTITAKRLLSVPTASFAPTEDLVDGSTVDVEASGLTTIDCATGYCFVVAESTEIAGGDDAPITFDTGTSAPTRTFAIVEGLQLRGDWDWRFQPAVVLRALDPAEIVDGAFTGTVAVQRWITTPTWFGPYGADEPQDWDCAALPAADPNFNCAVAVAWYDDGMLAGVGIFGAAADLAFRSPVEMVGVPDEGLVHHQLVTVTLTGLPPYAEVLLSQCRDGTGLAPWEDPYCFMFPFPDGPWLYADGDGALTVDVPVRRVLTTLFAEGTDPMLVVRPDRGLEDGDTVLVESYGGVFHPDNFVDCAEDGCALVANYGDGNWLGTPLGFDPVPAPPTYDVAIWQAMLEGPGPDLSPVTYFAAPIDGADPVLVGPDDLTPEGNFSIPLAVQRLVTTPYDAYGNEVSTAWDCASAAHDPDAPTSSVVCGVLVTVSETTPSPTGPWNAFWTHDLGFTPRGAAVTIDPVLWLRTGTTAPQARGTVSCEAPMQVHVEGLVTQTTTSRKKTTTVTGSFRSDVWCSGTTSWEATVWPLSGQFKKGPASVHLEASSLGHLTSSLDALVEIQTVRIK